MKELDLLLERFLERGFEDLSAEQLTCFEALLESPDQDLVDWIGGGTRPPSADLADIARCIRLNIGLEAGETPSHDLAPALGRIRVAVRNRETR